MKPKSILFVDDEPELLNSIRRMLKTKTPEWHSEYSLSVEDAVKKLKKNEFDTVVTDIRMPGQDGFELISFLRGGFRNNRIPILVLSGLDDSRLKPKVLGLGVTDFLNKPINVYELIARLKNMLNLKEYEDRLLDQNKILEKEVHAQTINLELTQREMIIRLAVMAEYYDSEIGQHVIRVASYSKKLAELYGCSPEFSESLYLTSPLHDIGKIGVPIQILHKKGKLNADDWVQIKKHCEIGWQILSGSFPQLDLFWEGNGDLNSLKRISNRFLNMASTVALSHHERWDGSGYPRGLKGEEIPLESRIVALADVYDALRSRRHYKAPFSEADTIQIIEDESGSHFDPELAKIFVQNRKIMGVIYEAKN